MKVLQGWDTFSRGFTFRKLYPAGWGSLSGHPHLGTDIICPSWTPVFAPFAGTSTQNNFAEGGNVVDFRCKGLVMRMMHLAKVVKTGPCNEGDLIAYTGNSGTATSGAHLHIDISKESVQIYNIDNFINPDTFDWGEGGDMSDEQFRALQNEYTAMDVAQRKVIDDNFNALWGWCNSLQILIGKMASTEALQDPQIAKAVKDSQEALKVAQSMPSTALTAEQLDTLNGWQGIVAAFKNLFHIK